MKWVIIAVAVVVGVAALVLIVGALLPRAHVAAVTAKFQAPPEQVYAAIRDVEGGVKWRTGLQKVEVLSGANQPLRWTETSDFGKLTYVREEDVPPARIVSRIADTDQGFGGTWTYEVIPSGPGSELRVTENGEVYSPLFRFMSRFVFGHYKTLETYARDLGKHLGEPVEPDRVHDR